MPHLLVDGVEVKNLATAVMDDKRVAKRYSFKDSTLSYREDSRIPFLKQRAHVRPMVDMSLVGLAFLTSVPIDPGTPLWLTVGGALFPDHLRLRGRVVYVHEERRAAIYRIGVRFTKLSTEAANALSMLHRTVGGLEIEVRCGQCGSSMRLKKKDEGRKIQCPQCGVRVRVRLS